MSRDIKYIGMDVHKEATVIAVLNGSGKLVMESIVETKASSILQFIHGLRGELHVTWEEGTWAAWLYDLLQPQVTQVRAPCFSTSKVDVAPPPLRCAGRASLRYGGSRVTAVVCTVGNKCRRALENQLEDGTLP